MPALSGRSPALHGRPGSACKSPGRLLVARQVDGRPITFSEAGAGFLARVLDYASSAIGLGEEEVAFTVPVEAYEHYQDWLTRVCEAAGIRRFRLLDEASAAALGYGMNIQANDVYLVVDFGGSPLDVSMVRVEGEAVGGKRCRVLGKGGADLGGAVIDTWLYQDVVARARKQPEDVRHFSSLLLLEVERAKEALTSADEAEVQATDPRTGAVIGVRYTRASASWSRRAAAWSSWAGWSIRTTGGYAAPQACGANVVCVRCRRIIARGRFPSRKPGPR